MAKITAGHCRWVTVVLLAAAPVLAQVPLDPRVDPRLDPRLNTRVEGRLLDASNLVGSGGYNLEASRGFPNSANLLITGNITAGRAFRGFSPVRDPSQLLISVPSATLNRFERDSIGVGDIALGRTQAIATPYFSTPTTATLSAPAALPSPRTSVPSFTRPFTSPRPDLLSGQPLGTDLGLRRELTPLAPADPLGFADPYVQSDAAVAGSPLFGLPRPPGMDPVDLSAAPGFLPPSTRALPQFPTLPGQQPPSLYDTVFGRLDPATRDLGLPVRESAEERDLVSAPPEPLATAPLAGPGPVPPLTIPADSPEATMASPLGAPAELAPDPALADGTEFEPLGRSVHEDFQAALRWVDAAEETEAAPAEEPAPTPGASAADQQSIIFARSIIEQPPKTFAGEEDTPVNQRIRRAEQLMKAGEFYRAAAQYELAATLEPDNPLIHLGRGHALLAAGDYLSALQSLARGIERFEDIGRFKIDLYEFVPDPNMLDIRRADLQNKLERRDDYRLRFLLGYIEYYGRLEKFGLPELRKAAEQAPPDSVIARFPQMLER